MPDAKETRREHNAQAVIALLNKWVAEGKGDGEEAYERLKAALAGSPLEIGSPGPDARPTDEKLREWAAVCADGFVDHPPALEHRRIVAAELLELRAEHAIALNAVENLTRAYDGATTELRAHRRAAGIKLDDIYAKMDCIAPVEHIVECVQAILVTKITHPEDLAEFMTAFDTWSASCVGGGTYEAMRAARTRLTRKDDDG